MAILDYLKPLTEKLENNSNTLNELHDKLKTVTLFVYMKTKLQRYINIALGIFPIVLLGIYHYLLR